MQIFQLFQDPLRGHTKRNPSVSVFSPPPTERIPKLPTPTSNSGHRQQHTLTHSSRSQAFISTRAAPNDHEILLVLGSEERDPVQRTKAKIHEKLCNQVTLSNRRTTAIKATQQNFESLPEDTVDGGRKQRRNETPRGRASERARQRSGREMNTTGIPRSNWLN